MAKHIRIPADQKVGDYKISIEQQLKLISEKVANYGDGQIKNYAHVGSLAHVSEELSNILKFLNNENW